MIVLRETKKEGWGQRNRISTFLMGLLLNVKISELHVQRPVEGL